MVGKVTPDTMMSTSRLPALLGISKYRSPNDELLASIAALKCEPREDITNEAMEWGNEFETTILKKAALRLGLDNLELDHPEPKFHELWPLCTSLDGTADGRGLVVTHDPDAGIHVIGSDSITLTGVGVLEAKLTRMDVEDVPPLWRGPVQLQGQMEILGAKWGAVCTLYQGTQLRIFLFTPHQGTLDAIEAAVYGFQRRLDFWKETGSIDYYPPISSVDADRTWSEAKAEDQLCMGDEEEYWVDQIVKAKAEIKVQEAVIAEGERKLKDIMRDHSLARTHRYEIKWPMRHYKATAERIVPAKEAYSVRQSTLSIKEIKNV